MRGVRRRCAARVVAASAALRSLWARGVLRQPPSQHATAHNRSSGHPIVQSYEPGEDWFYDYRSGDFLDSGPPPRTRQPPRRPARTGSGRGRAQRLATTLELTAGPRFVDDSLDSVRNFVFPRWLSSDLGGRRRSG